MSKRLLDSPVLQTALGAAIGGYMALCERTARWEESGHAFVAPFLAGRPMILAVWHGRLLQMQRAWPLHEARRPCHVLISKSREGQVIGRATQTLGHAVIHGSTAKAGKDKGSVMAMRELLKRLAEGDSVAITPDGPKGPRMRASLGVVQLAKLSGAPIVPATWSMRGARMGESWDRLLAPRPFGRGIIVWGAPIAVARRADAAQMEALRLRVETALNTLTATADRAMGLATVEPGEAPAPLTEAPALEAAAAS